MTTGGARTGIEDEIVRHIEEWRDSVQVGESVAIFELLDFSSSVYPGKHDPPVDAVMDYVFSARVEGVEGISDVMPKRAARTA
ncbi:hypothetical protein ABT124_24855 [Streptomyces sp. NPDC001982]|uniref:hypothetical protein n=1 Tax=Streptomyces sp. NPDC001982 TaxID=3154405 RepID=UPI003328F254